MKTEEITNIDPKRLKLFLRIYDSPARSGFANSQSDGPAAAALFKLGLLKKVDRIGRTQRWLANFENVTREQVKLMRELASTDDGTLEKRVLEIEKKMDQLLKNDEGKSDE